MPQAYIIAYYCDIISKDISSVLQGTDIIEKTPFAMQKRFFLELLGGLEPPTSSLPRMRSTA